MILVLVLSGAPRLHAALPTFDAVNAALNEAQNAILNSEFAKLILTAVEQARELRNQYLELIRYHAGLDDIVEVFIGDPFEALLQEGNEALRDAFRDLDDLLPEFEVLNQSTAPEDIRISIERLTGEILESGRRPYIPFEEMQVVEGFQLAQEIRRAGEATREAASQISTQARTASPKGAARLQVEALAKSILLAQTSQEAMAKLLELEATQVEQVSREEKRLEHERLKFMEDAVEFLSGVLRDEGGVLDAH